MTRILYEATVVFNFSGSGSLIAHSDLMKVDLGLHIWALTRFDWDRKPVYWSILIELINCPDVGAGARGGAAVHDTHPVVSRGRIQFQWFWILNRS